ncbi:MAG: hypothetical protein ACE5DM_02470 [Candidatus Nanoarchaeia archaeon]
MRPGVDVLVLADGLPERERSREDIWAPDSIPASNDEEGMNFNHNLVIRNLPEGVSYACLKTSSDLTDFLESRQPDKGKAKVYFLSDYVRPSQTENGEYVPFIQTFKGTGNTPKFEFTKNAQKILDRDPDALIFYTGTMVLKEELDPNKTAQYCRDNDIPVISYHEVGRVMELLQGRNEWDKWTGKRIMLDVKEDRARHNAAALAPMIGAPKAEQKKAA